MMMEYNRDALWKENLSFNLLAFMLASELCFSSQGHNTSSVANATYMALAPEAIY